jgi:hypothetical protein
MFKRNLIALALASASLSVQAGATFVNGIAIPADTVDSFGAGANVGRVGFFSDLYYDSSTRSWLGLSDRGPGGGTLAYDTRVQRFTVDINPTSGAISNFQIQETIKFQSNGSLIAAGSLNGIAPGLAPSSGSTAQLGLAFDPEGIVVNPRNGNLIVSDEYGPSVYEFNRSGQLTKVFVTPDNLIPRNATSGTANFASDTGNNAGKRTNRGFEGLAISPDGKHAYAMLQSAMLNEGGGNGTYNRIVKFDTETGQAVAQYLYKMEGSSQGRGISALVAIGNDKFLVLERNNRGVGVGAEFATQNKKVFEISLTGATDVSSITLTGGVLPAGVQTVSKASTPFLDLGANTLAAFGNKVAEKWEGLAFGPQLADGSFVMLAGTDNDYSVTQNANGQQFDVYFRFSDADPYGMSIQCPLDTKTNCFFTSNSASATLTAEYSLLPGLLYAYKVPTPATTGLLALGLLGVLAASRARKH